VVQDRTHQRARYLLKIADLIEQNADELATLESLNNGMAISLAHGMTSGAVDTFRYYADWSTKIYGETNPSDPAFFNYTLRETVGVCWQIIPWNGPIAMFAWKIAPALACGNVSIIKPARTDSAYCTPARRTDFSKLAFPKASSTSSPGLARPPVPLSRAILILTKLPSRV
jgi:acyl-CoA reductase-like NAD-dependent aldehyde dehydrogenase